MENLKTVNIPDKNLKDFEHLLLLVVDFLKQIKLIDEDISIINTDTLEDINSACIEIKRNYEK